MAGTRTAAGGGDKGGQRLPAGPGGAGNAPQGPPAPAAAAPGAPPPAPRGRRAGTARPLPPDPACARSRHLGEYRARPRLGEGCGGRDPTAAGSGVPRPRLTPCLACSSASRCRRSASSSSSAMAEGGRQALRLRHRCQCTAERGASLRGSGSRVGPRRRPSRRLPRRPPGPGKSDSGGGCVPSLGSFSFRGLLPVVPPHVEMVLCPDIEGSVLDRAAHGGKKLPAAQRDGSSAGCRGQRCPSSWSVSLSP